MTAGLTQFFAVPYEDHWRRRKQVFAVPLHENALQVSRRKSFDLSEFRRAIKSERS